MNHIILAKEKHGRENSKSSLFLTVIKCRYLLQKTYLITIRNIMKNRLSYMNSSKFQEIIRHVLPLAKIIRNYWTIEREQGYCTCSQTWGKFNYYGWSQNFTDGSNYKYSTTTWRYGDSSNYKYSRIWIQVFYSGTKFCNLFEFTAIT